MQPDQAAPVVAAVQQAGRKPQAIHTAALQLIQNPKCLCRLKAMRQRQNQKLPFTEFEEICQIKMTFTLVDPVDIISALAAGEQLAQPAVSRAVARVDQDIWRAVHKDEA